MWFRRYMLLSRQRLLVALFAQLLLTTQLRIAPCYTYVLSIALVQVTIRKLGNDHIAARYRF